MTSLQPPHPNVHLDSCLDQIKIVLLFGLAERRLYGFNTVSATPQSISFGAVGPTLRLGFCRLPAANDRLMTSPCLLSLPLQEL